MHPRILTEGFELAHAKALQVLEDVKISGEMNRERLINVANTCLHTKVNPKLADCLTDVSYFFNRLAYNT